MPEEIIKKAKEEKKEKSLNRKSAAAASNLLKVYEELNKPKKNLSAYLFFSVDKRWVTTRMGTFITYCLDQQKLDVSRYIMMLWKDRIV